MAGSRATRFAIAHEAPLAATSVEPRATSHPNITPHIGDANLNSNVPHYSDPIIPPQWARTIQTPPLQIQSPIPMQ